MKIIMKKKNRNLICTYKSAMFSTQYASNSSGVRRCQKVGGGGGGGTQTRNLCTFGKEPI